MGKTGRGPGDCLGPVPASDIALSADVDASSFMVEEPDLFTQVLSCAIAGVVKAMSAAIRCFTVSYLAVVAISVRAFARRGRGETVDQGRCTRGLWQGSGPNPPRLKPQDDRQDEVEASVPREPAYGAPLLQKPACQ